MNAQDYNCLVLTPALSILPSRMDSPEARAMLIAIALQESSLVHRRQINGPARSFLQFEEIGIKGVLEHPASQELAHGVCRVLGYDADPTELHAAVADNDILSACFGRLLLWRLPEPLPLHNQGPEGWNQYLECWRPGKPRRAHWANNFRTGWSVVLPTPHRAT